MRLKIHCCSPPEASQKPLTSEMWRTRILRGVAVSISSHVQRHLLISRHVSPRADVVWPGAQPPFTLLSSLRHEASSSEDAPLLD